LGDLSSLSVVGNIIAANANITTNLDIGANLNVSNIKVTSTANITTLIASTFLTQQLMAHLIKFL
jgi:hypothetical protein